MIRVCRVTNEPRSLRITFNAIGRALEWGPASEGGSPQDVPDSVVEAIESDPSLAPHFRIGRVDPEAAPAIEDRGAVRPTPSARPTDRRPAK